MKSDSVAILTVLMINDYASMAPLRLVSLAKLRMFWVAHFLPSTLQERFLEEFGSSGEMDLDDSRAEINALLVRTSWQTRRTACLKFGAVRGARLIQSTRLVSIDEFLTALETVRARSVICSRLTSCIFCLTSIRIVR